MDSRCSGPPVALLQIGLNCACCEVLYFWDYLTLTMLLWYCWEVAFILRWSLFRWLQNEVHLYTGSTTFTVWSGKIHIYFYILPVLSSYTPSSHCHCVLPYLGSCWPPVSAHPADYRMSSTMAWTYSTKESKIQPNSADCKHIQCNPGIEATHGKVQSTYGLNFFLSWSEFWSNKALV